MDTFDRIEEIDAMLSRGDFKTFAPKETVGMDTHGKTLVLIGTRNIRMHGTVRESGSG